MSRLYQLTLSELQMVIIGRALDMWDRAHAGQLETALAPIGQPGANHTQVQVAIACLRMAAFPGLAASASGDFTFPGGKLAFNLRKVVEHAVSWMARPLAKGDFPTVNYDGPLEGWWEGEPAAVALVFEGEEAVRIRDRVNQEVTLYGKLAAELGTQDVEEAVRIVRALRAAAGGAS